MINFLRALLRYISYILTLVAVGLYLLAAMAPYIPPARIELVALMGMFFPFFLGGMILATLYWILRLNWRMLLALMAVYALSWGSLSAYFPINRSATHEVLSKQGEAKPLKVLSYNVCAFGFARHSVRKPNRCLLYLRSSEADIICLQEALTAGDSQWGVTEEQIKAYLGGKYPYIETIAAQGGGSRLMILSRYPISEGERIDIDSRANGAAAWTVDIEGRPTKVINLHLESFRLPPSTGEEYMKLVAEGEGFALKDAMQSRLGPVFLQHNYQANRIHEYITKTGSERTIVCGDFNDTPVSYAVGKIGKGLTNAFTKAGNGLGISFRSRYFRVRIDHILVGAAFTPLLTEVDVSARGSDHYPIYTYILDKEG
ncbi:MAG: endonuclease/exonuclease/phosphatase family protein [Porphyromonas sp.]|nr:endonuclease/exonuclease/phosphatase family protein [Porphyromonas sp.]